MNLFTWSFLLAVLLSLALRLYLSQRQIRHVRQHTAEVPAAFRFVGNWQDLQGERRFEYHKNFNLTPSLTLKPLDSGKLTLNLEFEYLKERYNANDYDWIYSDFAGWKAA